MVLIPKDVICYPNQNKAENIKYTIQHISAAKKPILKVTATFNLPTQNSKIYFPNTWISNINYFKDIKDIKILSKGTSIFDTEDPYVKLLKHSSPAPIIIEYTILPHDMNADQHPYYNIIEDNFFHFFGYGVFCYPDIQTDKNIPITIKWKTNEKHNLINSFGQNTREQELNVSIDRLNRSSYWGGLYGLKKVKIHNTEFHIVYTKSTEALSHTIANLAKKIFNYQREFWKDYDYPFYFIGLIKDYNLQSMYSGTSVENAIILYIDNTSPISMDQMAIFIAHENWHNWLGGAKLKQPDHYESTLWLHEGFTDYYAGITALRSGAITLEQYIKYYNDTLQEHFLSSYNEVSNEDIETNFHNSYQISKVPYTRGHILAQELNYRLKKDSNNKVSLDSVMLGFYKDYQKSKDYTLDLDSFLKGISKYINLNKEYLLGYIRDGKLLYPSNDSLGNCFKISTEQVTKQEYPIDVDSSIKRKTITGLIKDSYLSKKGILEGASVLEYHIDDYMSKGAGIIDLQILQDDKARWYRIVPVNRSISIPQYHFREAATRDNYSNCLQYFK
jgi:predicted metalloprotease with PDZ domain